MKNLILPFTILILVSFSFVTSAQNISVYPQYPPRAICDGDSPTLIINKSAIPTGKKIAFYKFWLDSLKLPTQIGISPANTSSPEEYTFAYNKPGIYTATGAVIFTDSSRWYAGTITVIIYNRPIADFSLAQNTKDTQCFNKNGNSFCFINNSSQNTNSPSNPIVKSSSYWFWGDGGASNDTNHIVCQSYETVGQRNIILSITDDHGCSSRKQNPSGYDTIGITVLPSVTSNFTWTGSMSCFGSTYVFKNQSTTKASNIKSYTWDFGDSTNYTAISPFSTLQSSHYDTITHKYILSGTFFPSLILKDTFGCIDTLKKNYSNYTKPLPGNIIYDSKITASTFSGNQQNNRDSFCVGANYTQVYFNHAPIPFLNPQDGTFVWDFGDPIDPNNNNWDSSSWNPSHVYSGVGKYIVKFSVKHICKDSTMYDTIDILGPKAKIENAANGSVISDLHKYQCDGSDTVDFVNNSMYHKSTHVKSVWDFDDDYAPKCTAYSVPKNSSQTVFSNAQQQYNNSDHFYVINGTAYAGKMNCKYSNDSLPRHLYTNWDSVYYWYQNGKTFPPSWNIPNINANTSLTISASKPVPDPFWQEQGKYLNLTTGTLRNKFDSITYTIPGFGTFKRYGNQVLPNSSITFHEFVFRYTVNRAFNVKLNLTDSLNHSSGSTTSCTSADALNLSHGKPDAHGMSITGRQCPGLNGGGTMGSVTFNLRANGIGLGTKPSCGQTYIYLNIDSLADRMDNTPYFLDGFTTWGVGPFGTPITPGPGTNTTPGFLTRNTFYTGMNWNPIPPSPWTKPDGSTIVYHYGANSGTPPPADSINGYVTIGLFLGSGQKDTTLQVWKSNYLLNQTNSGAPLRDTAGRIFSWNPADPAGMGYPWTYQNYLLIDQIANRTTPPPTPIPNGWIDDSLAYTYSFHAVINSTPQIRYTSPSIVWDTLLTIQYIDFNNPRCISDTVWYHNFLHLKANDASMVKSPIEILPTGQSLAYPASYLREREDTVWEVYQNNVQDNIKTSDLDWGDFTATVDSFYYAGYDITDGYYTNGFRRVRYNIDYSNFSSAPVVLDSTVWPCGVYGQKQYLQPLNSYSRIFDVIGTIAPDTLILRNKFPSTTHFDKWYPYTNYHDTIHLRKHDTILYTQFNTIDTSMMLFPIWHVYHKTSWETALHAGLLQNSINTIVNFVTNVQKCQYNIGQYITIGIIDTMRILNANGIDDTIFCKNESIRFIDSLRYWRFDNQVTDISIPIWGTSRPDGYHGNYGNFEPSAGYPWDSYQFDTIDFWLRDVQDPSDTLINYTSIFSNSQIDFKYFPNKWTNYDKNLNYLPFIGTPLTGHWDAVLRGGNVKVLLPNNSTDSAYENIYSGMVIFIPIATSIGNPGIYVWGNNGWVASFSPIKIDSLNSLSDISKTTSPVIGRTLIYNKGKGAIKKIGMYYWGGTQWIFIANNPYTTFPFFTHRVYWNFGDSSPIYQGVQPTHKYATSGTFKVSMISRDSIGHFDTCVSFVNITDIVSKPTTANTTINCNTNTVQFFDSSYTNNSSQIKRHFWFLYDNAKDPFAWESQLANPVWHYTHNGKYIVKLVTENDRGCSATGFLTLYKNGPRPAFKLLSNIIGCKPYRVGVLNLADSFDKRSPADTPTISTSIYWGDATLSHVVGRRDTVWHTYNDNGVYQIFAIGRDALPNEPVTCPEVYYPDTSSGQSAIYVKVSSSNVGKIIGNTNPNMNDTTTYFVANELGVTYTWTVQSGLLLSGAGTNMITVKWPSTSGLFNIIAEKINPFGCTDRDTLLVHVLMTAIKELSSVTEIKMYPNPAKNNITISLNSQKNQNLNIKIYDVLGKVCLNDFFKSQSGMVNKNYSLNELSKGMYFVEISNEEEKTVFKLLIE